jgi:hypothetical protein
LRRPAPSLLTPRGPKGIQAGRAIGTLVSGHDAAAEGPYRMSWLFANDVPAVVAAVLAAGAPRRAAPNAPWRSMGLRG